MNNYGKFRVALCSSGFNFCIYDILLIIKTLILLGIYFRVSTNICDTRNKNEKKN